MSKELEALEKNLDLDLIDINEIYYRYDDFREENLGLLIKLKQLLTLSTVKTRIAIDVVSDKCVNVLFDCPVCEEPISNERFHGMPINYCPNCGVELLNAINWETKKYQIKQERTKYLNRSDKR